MSGAVGGVLRAFVSRARKRGAAARPSSHASVRVWVLSMRRARACRDSSIDRARGAGIGRHVWGQEREAETLGSLFLVPPCAPPPGTPRPDDRSLVLESVPLRARCRRPRPGG